MPKLWIRHHQYGDDTQQYIHLSKLLEATMCSRPVFIDMIKWLRENKIETESIQDESWLGDILNDILFSCYVTAMENGAR